MLELLVALDKDVVKEDFGVVRYVALNELDPPDDFPDEFYRTNLNNNAEVYCPLLLEELLMLVMEFLPAQDLNNFACCSKVCLKVSRNQFIWKQKSLKEKMPEYSAKKIKLVQNYLELYKRLFFFKKFESFHYCYGS